MARVKAGGEAPTGKTFLESLLELGFSQYEARCYIGLVGRGPQTGYAVAKTTGVPQPKVYEALRKLVSRGAAYEVAGSPVRFLSTPPDALLDEVENAVTASLRQARLAAAELGQTGAAKVEALASYDGWPSAWEAAVRLVEGAERRIYVSAGAAQLAELGTELQAAMDRGVDVVVLCFGVLPFEDSRMKVYRHLSTEGVIYRSHQARHLAVIADSSSAVWALANDGRTWSALESDNALVIAALKGFIRHDIDMQQVFDDFGPQLIARYGPGLEALERYRQVPGQDRVPASDPAKPGRRRRTAG